MYTPHSSHHPVMTHKDPHRSRKNNPWDRRKNTSSLPHLQEVPLPEDPIENLDFPLNIFQVPGFVPNRITEEMERLLEGDGGHLDQIYLYWEPQNARMFCQLTEHKDYIPQHGFPHQQVTKSIASYMNSALKADEKKIEVLAIGPGNGKKELHLLQELVETMPDLKHMLVNLLDISQPLLGESYNNAQTIFSEDSRIKAWGMQGNMHHLSQYYPLRSLIMKPRPRVITLLGGLLGNLANESLFIQNISQAFRKGDLFVVEVGNIYAPANEPHTIHTKDPRLSGKLPKLWSESDRKLFTGPFERHYGRRLKDISITPTLDTSSKCIQGSYAINMIADLTLTNQTTKQFIVHRFVRYEPNALIHMFNQLGWEPVDTWRFGKQKDYLLFLFQKR